MERIYPHPFFAREGWAIMGIAFVIALLVQLFVGGFVAAIFWLLFIFVAQFFRDPAREMTDDEKAVVAPVDGRVIKVEEAVCPYTGEQTKLVSIFMNVFNVHSQKTPVAGKIEKIEYKRNYIKISGGDSCDRRRSARMLRADCRTCGPTYSVLSHGR